MPKGKIIEDIIQKSVELGAHRIVPLLTERVVTHLDDRERRHKREKWQQVAIEAIKQCGAAWLPKIEHADDHRGGSEARSLKPEANPLPAPRLQPSAFSLQPLICPWSARCKPNVAIHATVFRNFRQSMDASRKVSPFGSARKAISRRKN